MLSIDEYFESMKVITLSNDGSKTINILNSFGSRLIIACLELKLNATYNAVTKTIDITKLEEAIHVKFDKHAIKYAEIIHSAVKTQKVIDRLYNNLMKYDAIEKAVARVNMHDYETLSLRETIETLIAVKSGIEDMSSDKTEAIKMYDDILKQVKDIIEDVDDSAKVRIVKQDQIEFLEDLGVM